jgi:sulfate adenylyltransferase
MNAPHGNILVERILDDNAKRRVLEDKDILRVNISAEIASDVENIAYGILSPLKGFLSREDFISVIKRGRLSNDLPWTIPIVLDVDSSIAKSMKDAKDVLLSCNGRSIALMQVDEYYSYDKIEMARSVYQTTDPSHPGVAKTFSMHDTLVSGEVYLIDSMPIDGRLSKYRLTPRQCRSIFASKGWKSIVGFQTRNIPHLAHEMLQKSVLNFFDALLVNPLIGKKKPGDAKDEVIVEAYEVLIENYYPKDRVLFATLHTEMRYAGPKEAIHHAIMRKNLGCTHFIVGRDHAGVGSFYKPFAAQEIFKEYPDLGIEPIFFPAFFYCKRCMGIVSERMCPHDSSFRLELSGTKLRSMISRGERPSELLMRPEVVDVIMRYKEPFVT